MRFFSRQPPTRRARIARPIVAAAQTASGPGAQNLRRLSQPWQVRSLADYDTVPEAWFPAQFYARTLQKIRFFPAILDEKGDPQEVETGPLVDLFDRVQDRGGGRSELTGAYGRLMFLTGDGYLTVTEQDGEEAWEFLSPLELRVKPESGGGRPQEYERLRAPGIPLEELTEAPDTDFEPLGNEARVWRLWRRHPAFTQLADSPVRAVLDLYELLTHLTLAASAESKSRAANRGAIFVPDELDFGGQDDDEADEDPDSDPFLSMLTDALTSAIANPGSASAMSPIVVRGKGFYDTPTGTIATKDMIGWLPLGPDAKYAESDMIDKVINRIAGGLDLPREFVSPEGVGQANHWTGWLLDDQSFRLYASPIAQKFCEDVNAAYLRPAAIDAGIADADRVVIGYDPAAAINHPDEAKTARDAFNDGVVSSVFYREKIGATDDDAPTDDDLDLILALKGKTLPGDEEPQGETAPQDGGQGGDVDETAPDTEDDQDAPAAAVAAAVGMQIHRARELAGNRLIRRAQGCDDCKQRIIGVAPSLVASTLGREVVREIINGHATEAQLVAGAGETLTDTVRGWGLNEQTSVTLGRLVEEQALASLYEPDPPTNLRRLAAVIGSAT